jgi:uncharacterized phage protein gp47/JayE
MGSAIGFTPKAQQDFVNDQSNAWGASLNISPVLVPGDPALAFFESNSVVAIFLESLLQAVINMARASTATGADLDSFVADFGISRLPATMAEGAVIFSTSQPVTSPIYIPVGALVQTPGGAVIYQVVADTTQPGYVPSQDAYVILTGQSSVTATVQSTQAGANQNVQANQLTQIGSGISSVSTVTNSAPIINGQDAESDAALRVRFIAYLASLSKATEQALLYAITSVQQGLKVNLLDNEGPQEQQIFGYFTAVVDGGGGTLSSDLQTLIIAAIETTRAFTINYAVVAPTTVTANVTMTFRVVSNPTESVSTIETNITNALQTYITGLGIGATLYISQLEQIAINADPNVLAVQEATTLINGVNRDLTISATQEALPGTITLETF